MLKTPFLTDLDWRAAVESSRDPLGIQQVFGVNLTCTSFCLSPLAAADVISGFVFEQANKSVASKLQTEITA
jgi:hypothetical protein